MIENNKLIMDIKLNQSSSIEEIRQSCKQWQEILRLQDWDISVVFADLHQLGNCTLGTVHVHEETKSAEIHLLQPGMESSTSFPSYEINSVLVHELLHLHFKPFEAKKWKSPKGIAQEQAIELLSRSLISLRFKDLETF